MKSSDRPPLASDLSCDVDRHNDEEDFRRQMSQPSLPKWHDRSDEPCLCASPSEPHIIAVHVVPFGPVLHLLECLSCGEVWKKVEQTDSDCSDNPAKN